MKNIILIAVLCLAGLTSCKKAESIGSPPSPDNFWTYSGKTFRAAYSEVNTRGGYQISFRPAGDTGLDHSISFRFLQKPAIAGDYVLAVEPSSTTQVGITLETGTLPNHHALAGNNARVAVSFSENKLRLSLSAIKAVRDSTGVDTLVVNASLAEY